MICLLCDDDQVDAAKFGLDAHKRFYTDVGDLSSLDIGTREYQTSGVEVAMDELGWPLHDTPDAAATAHPSQPVAREFRTSKSADGIPLMNRAYRNDRSPLPQVPDSPMSPQQTPPPTNAAGSSDPPSTPTPQPESDTAIDTTTAHEASKEDKDHPELRTQDTPFPHSRATKQPTMMDMTSDASAALAATLPSRLPPIPREAMNRVGEETCVWLNAFVGRLYRDAVRSPHFHHWMGERIENALNQGRPPHALIPTR